MEQIIMVTKLVHWNQVSIWRLCIMVSKGYFQTWWFAPYRIQYYLHNNTILLITIDKFDPNPMFVNINKLKPYMFTKDTTLQVVLVKPSDLITYEHVQTKEPEPLLLVEREEFQLVEFEPVAIWHMVTLKEHMCMFIITIRTMM